MVPLGITGNITEIRIRNGGLISAALTVPVTKWAPGIFTLNETGTGPAAILNQDASVNSPTNAARRDQVVSIFATGAGPLSPPDLDGVIGKGIAHRITEPVEVRIGGIVSEVLYAGSAPELVTGTIQINCRIPAGAPVGPAVEVELKVGGAASPAGTTMSIMF